MPPDSKPRRDVDELVLEAALALAEEGGWAEVRLYEVADRSGLTLDAIGRRFRDLDAVANLWFERARLAMLSVDAAELVDRTTDERLASVIERWLDTMAPHRRTTGEMLRSKLWPSHPHHWVPMVFDLSRVIHDMLDAARVEGDGLRRGGQEIGLTTVVLATLCHWQCDGSEGQNRTKERLRRRLACGGRMIGWLPSR